MGESRDPFTAEELYELRREDLNEFTSEDERMPSPKDVRAEETIVLPEIQTMTGYIRQHYEAVLVDEISRRLRYGELGVRHGGKLYRECPWTGPEDYPKEDGDDVTVLNTPIEHQCSVASDQKGALATVRPLGGEITWTSFNRASWNFVEAFVVITMKVDAANDTEHFETTERYAIDMWFDMEDAIDQAQDNVRVYIPLDLNKAAILRRLESVIAQYDKVNEKNESAFGMDVELLIAQIEIYDQVWFVRNLPTNVKHSNEAVALVKEFVARLEDIPDDCAECFPFEAIDALRQEYLA